MRNVLARRGLVVLVIWALFALWAVGAAAQPGMGPRETVDQNFTTAAANSPTGLGYTAAYHAAGNPQGNPPYLRRMVFYPPPGMRYDTSVPDRCSATDAELAVQGTAACPPGSRLGGGTTEGLFFQPVTHAFVLDHFQHTLDVVNNANQQILLIKSEGFTVVRGQIHPDGSIEFNPPTCFPAPPTGQCGDDYILQLKTSTFLAPFTRTIGGVVRNYATTPPTCPVGGKWQSMLRFWWADGSVDTVVSDQPCTGPPPVTSSGHLPAARSCASRRAFIIRLPRVHAPDRIVSASVLVSGSHTRVLRGRRLRASVDLRGLPRGAFRITVILRTARRRTLRQARTYHTCISRRATPHT